jgi:hypothetical protein
MFCFFCFHIRLRQTSRVNSGHFQISVLDTCTLYVEATFLTKDEWLKSPRWTYIKNIAFKVVKRESIVERLGPRVVRIGLGRRPIVEASESFAQSPLFVAAHITLPYGLRTYIFTQFVKFVS